MQAVSRQQRQRFGEAASHPKYDRRMWRRFDQSFSSQLGLVIDVSWTWIEVFIDPDRSVGRNKGVAVDRRAAGVDKSTRCLLGRLGEEYIGNRNVGLSEF
jgi:hypothetical protein